MGKGGSLIRSASLRSIWGYYSNPTYMGQLVDGFENMQTSAMNTKSHVNMLLSLVE